MPEPQADLDGSRAALGGAGLWLLLLWAALCALWNLYGAAQIASGGRALGPTASYAGAGLALGIAVLLVATRHRPWILRSLAIVAGVLGAFTIWNSFVLDRSLWPSEFWRWAGIAVNVTGVAGMLLTLVSGGGSPDGGRG